MSCPEELFSFSMYVCTHPHILCVWRAYGAREGIRHTATGVTDSTPPLTHTDTHACTHAHMRTQTGLEMTAMPTT